MKIDWPHKPLGDLLAVQNGYAFDSKSFNPSDGIPLIRIRDLKGGTRTETLYSGEYDEKYLVKAGDLLIGMDGEFGCYEWRGDTALLNQRVCKLQNFNGALAPRFLFYGVNSHLRAIEEITGYATVKHLSSKQILSIRFPVPTLREQQRIVAILDEAFEGIATAKAKAEKNLQNARALFESHLESVFTERDPEWAEEPIGRVAEVFDGPHATPKTVDAGPVFLGISALQDGRINLGETRHVTPDDFQRWTRRVRPQTDDVVFSYETRLGQAAIIPPDLQCCLGRRMGLVRVDRKRLDPRFFVYQYISGPFREFLASRTVRGATVDRIPLKEFPSFLIRLPRLNEQERLADQFENLREETQRLVGLYERKLATLDVLKKSLLNQAFIGQL